MRILSYNKSGEWCEAHAGSGTVGWVTLTVIIIIMIIIIIINIVIVIIINIINIIIVMGARDTQRP